MTLASVRPTAFSAWRCTRHTQPHAVSRVYPETSAEKGLRDQRLHSAVARVSPSPGQAKLNAAQLYVSEGCTYSGATTA